MSEIAAEIARSLYGRVDEHLERIGSPTLGTCDYYFAEDEIDAALAPLVTAAEGLLLHWPIVTQVLNGHGEADPTGYDREALRSALRRLGRRDEPECTCYESWAGHQPGCALAKRPPVEEERG